MKKLGTKQGKNMRIQEENKTQFNRSRKKPKKYKVRDLVAIQRTQFGSGLKLKRKVFWSLQNYSGQEKQSLLCSSQNARRTFCNVKCSRIHKTMGSMTYKKLWISESRLSKL